MQKYWKEGGRDESLHRCWQTTYKNVIDVLSCTEEMRTCVYVCTCVDVCGCALMLWLRHIEGWGEGGGMRGEGNCIGIRYTDRNCLDLVWFDFFSFLFIFFRFGFAQNRFDEKRGDDQWCVWGRKREGGNGGEIGDGESKEGYVVSPPLSLSLPLSNFLFYNHSILIFYLSQ